MRKNFYFFIPIIILLIFISGCGDDASVSLPSTTVKLVVKVIPADAVVTAVNVNVSSSSSASSLQSSAQGEYYINVASGIYTLNVTATGYNPVFQQITVASGQTSQEVTVNLATGEVQIGLSNLEPRVAVKSGDYQVPMSIPGSNFSGTGTVELLDANTVVQTVTGTVSDPNTMKCTFDISSLEPTKEYTIKVNHNPPVQSSTTTATSTYKFYVTSTIQDAVIKANSLYSSDGGTNQVKAFVPAGTYSETVTMKSGVYLYGNSDITDPNSVTNKTIINGGTTSSIFTASSIQNFTIAGLTMQNASFISSGGISASDSDKKGGAIKADSVSGITVKNNSVHNCSADDFGGGVYIKGSGNITITGNSFYRNSSHYSSGGALYIILSSVSVVNILSNNFTENNSVIYSGGVYISSGASSGIICNIDKNVFSKNTVSNINANVLGGGLSVILDSSSANITNNIVDGNELIAGGINGAARAGGIYLSVSGANSTCNITGNSITNNKSTATSNAYGGGIYYVADVSTTGIATINQNNIYGNTSVTSGRQLYNASSIITVDATNNWWGTSSGPGASDISGPGTVTTSPYATQEFSIP